MDDLLSDWNEQQQNQEGNLVWKEIAGAPKFQNSEIEFLYAWGFDIPKEVISAILELPRASLIADLHLVLEDAKSRYEAYLAKDLEKPDTPLPLSAVSFPAHAMFLLSELESEESLGKVLKFLSQPSEVLDFWLGELDSVHLWPILLRLGKEDLPALQKYVRNHDAGVLYRSIAINALGQIAWHYSARRKEVFSWFESFFEFFLDNLEDDEETGLVGDAVSEVANLRAVDLLDTIEPLFDADLVDTSVCGTFREVQGDMYEPVNSWAKVHVKNIFETYNHFSDTWEIYADEGEEDDAELLSGGAFMSGKEKKKQMASFNPEGQPVKKDSKTGRNDPCPCGSGKKFKSCHGL